MWAPLPASKQQSGRSPRVLISGHETCGLIRDLAKEFKHRGYDVGTVALPDPFVPGIYDYDQYDFPTSFLSRRFGLERLWEIGFKALWELHRPWHAAVERRLRIVLASSADVYLRVWGGIPFDREVLHAVSQGKTRIGVLLMGSDVRDYDVFRQQFRMTRWNFPPEYYVTSFQSKMDTLRTYERYAHAIFSVPDQMGLALRPYHHLQIPLHLDQYEFAVSSRAVARVMHAPSVPAMKGTDVIEAALETLRSEGVQFEYVPVRAVAHPKLLQMLTEADVLVDQLIVHGPGWLGFEAMASGCAVATHFLESSPDCFRPPVWSISHDTIVNRLRTLLTDVQLRVRLANEGRRYVEGHNAADRVVDAVLEKVMAGHASSPDYFPTYLTSAYIPKDDDQRRAINAANAQVAGETWYRDFVAGAGHDGLVF